MSYKMFAYNDKINRNTVFKFVCKIQAFCVLLFCASERFYGLIRKVFIYAKKNLLYFPLQNISKILSAMYNKLFIYYLLPVSDCKDNKGYILHNCCIKISNMFNAVIVKIKSIAYFADICRLREKLYA